MLAYGILFRMYTDDAPGDFVMSAKIFDNETAFISQRENFPMETSPPVSGCIGKVRRLVKEPFSYVVQLNGCKACENEGRSSCTGIGHNELSIGEREIVGRISMVS